MDEHRLSLTRTRDGHMIFLNSNGRCLGFSPSMWNELTAMIRDFNATGAPHMANYVEHLPTRTPIHANRPSTNTLEDLA